MGKNILITLAVMACVATTSEVFADSGMTFTNENTTVIGGVIFAPSANVNVNAMSSDSSGSPQNRYCVTSWHAGAVYQSSGKQYAALSSGSAAEIVSTSLATITAPATCTAVDVLPSGTWQ